MDMRPERQKNIFSSHKFWIALLCFLIFGLVLALSKEGFSIVRILASIMLALLLAFLSFSALLLIFNNLNPQLQQKEGAPIQEAVLNGMLFVIPFTILAFVAKFFFGWNAMMPFVSTALTTAMATTGSELMKRGGQGAKNVLLPSLLAFVISTMWILFLSLIP